MNDVLIEIPWIEFQDCFPPINKPILVYNPFLIRNDFLTGYQTWFWDIASEELFKQGLLSFSHWVPLQAPAVRFDKKAA